MRIDPIEPAAKINGEVPEGVNYKQRAAIIVVFIGVFYFLLKVIFNL